MKVLTGLCLAAAWLGISSTAHAGPSRVEQAQAIALKRTGPVCTKDGGKVSIIRSGSVPGLARARYSFSPVEAADDRAAYFNCQIEFQRGHIPWRQFCHAMVHEYMHLAAWRAKAGEEYVGPNIAGQMVRDRKHSKDPASLMYVRPEKIYFRCRKRPPTTVTTPIQKPEPKPTVLLLPGGGWQVAKPETMQPWVDDFRAHGINARAITYPLRDVKAAIDYVRAEAQKERGPVVLYGISAGGTIASYLAAEGAVRAAVNVVGPTDLTRWVGSGWVFLKEIGLTQYDRQKAVSPYWRLGPDTSPQLVQCGLADPLVTYEQCVRYEGAARGYQRDTRLDSLINGHGQTPSERAVAREWVAARLR